MDKGSIQCKNCGHHFVANYCNQCGQKADTYRITWMEVLHHLPHALFHIDSGFFFTLKELATRPGHTIREYLEGRRKPHFSPFLMLVLLGGLTTILFVHFHLPTIFASIRLDQLEQEHSTIAHKYFALRMLVFVTVCSLGDSVFFRRQDYTFPEMFVANTFIFCGVSAIQLLSIPVMVMAQQSTAHMAISMGMIGLVMVYLVWSRVQFFHLYSSIHLLRIILAVLLYLAAVIAIGHYIIRPLFAVSTN